MGPVWLVCQLAIIGQASILVHAAPAGQDPVFPHRHTSYQLT
jgi:hypothetical protein